MVKDSDFKFDKHIPRDSPDMTPQKIFEKGAWPGSREPPQLQIHLADICTFWVPSSNWMFFTAFCEQKTKKEEKTDKGEMDKKQLDSAKDSDRSMVSPAKSDLVENEENRECAEYWPVCTGILYCYQRHC